MEADYGGADSPDETEIEQCVGDACRFVKICIQLLGLPDIRLSPSSDADE
jgi:hypothetical protein